MGFKNWRRFSAIVLSTLLVLTMAGCGEKLCIAGFGDCSIRGTMEQPATGSRMTISANTTDMKAGERREIVVYGGTGQISLTITQGSGSFAGPMIGNSGIYVAPLNPSVTGTSVVITARDSAFKDELSDPGKYHWNSVSFMVYP